MRLVEVSRLVCFLIATTCSALPHLALADAERPKMGIFATIGETIDLNLKFTNAAGKTVALSELILPGVPFILVPAFYDCPRLCGLTLTGVTRLVNELPGQLGKDYTVITYSFNPDEGAEIAAGKKKSVLANVNQKPLAESAWEFLVADKETISKINNQLGFRVRYADKELEHSSAIFFFSPDGTLRKYLAGVEFDRRKAEQALKSS